MPLVEIQDLEVSFPQAEGVIHAVRGAPRSTSRRASPWHRGESVGQVRDLHGGLRLLREPPAASAPSRLEVDGTEMLGADRRTLGACGAGAAMVFQDPMTAFDRLHIATRSRNIRPHRPASKGEARAEALRSFSASRSAILRRAGH
jgi:ABC-type microcin C transport system duplicated ATPase subunit YejF